MATDEDRSLGSGMSLPMWMKSRSRLHDRLDFDQNTFSPPENDDSFLYIKYPKFNNNQNQNLSSNNNTITVTDKTISANALPATNAASRINITKHTEPCKSFLLGTRDPPPQKLNSTGKTKSAGTDDGFKGEAAACGSSVIRVASQMVSGKVVRGFDSFEDEEKEHMRSVGFDPKLRRGSRSLPASPLQSPASSPKGKRKQLANKYFTGSTVDEKKPGSILANILAMRDQSRSVTSIAEEQTTSQVTQGSILAAAMKLQSITVEEDKPKPKPSHLREMNFWSPTSM